jgi:hypothetical protein
MQLPVKKLSSGQVPAFVVLQEEDEITAEIPSRAIAIVHHLAIRAGALKQSGETHLSPEAN